MKRRTAVILPLATLGLLLASLWLMSDATRGSARFGQLYSILLIINAAGLLSLAVLIGYNLYRLLRQIRERQPGARLTGRMTAVFVALAVIPVLVVYYFSLEFLHRGIDSWFDVRVEQALQDALDLGRTSLGVRMRELLHQIETLADDLAEEEVDISRRLDDARRLSGASELTLIGPQGMIIAFSAIMPTEIIPDRPNDAILTQLRQAGNYIDLDPAEDAGLQIRVVVRLPDPVSSEESRILQGLFPVSQRMSRLADSVESAYRQYRELAYLRNPLKLSFTLTLSLVLLLSIFAAVWAALFSARRMVAPLRDVALGTQAVAAGDYETYLPPAGKDVIGFLVTSFNKMTHELSRARDAARRNRRQVEEQRGYLETVLGRLSNGVLTFDQGGRLHITNQAAHEILDVELGELAGSTLSELGAARPPLRPLAEKLEPHLRGARGRARTWQEEISLAGAGGRRILMCSGARLAGPEGSPSGHVVVFNDLTELVEAQRKAAWSEVARRLAHEIKNPLTPIQLSAERLRSKYLSRMEPEEGELLDRLTRTIVQQVEAMMTMVRAFSDYARSPQSRPERLDLNALVRDVLEMYRDERARVPVLARLDPKLPVLEADPDHLRQVLHNLVKNAFEACAEGPGVRVEVETSRITRANRCFAEFRITDTGPGFPEEIIGRVFEPYTTSKPGGTGLGLAIVKKIVEEHRGRIWAENRRDGGGCVVLRFPSPEQPVPRTQPGSRQVSA